MLFRSQRKQLDLLAEMNREHLASRGGVDAALQGRIEAMETAYRMQFAATDAFDITREPANVREAYGKGHFANGCLMARRLAERGVRFIQLFHRGWDQHAKLPSQIAGQCRDTDQPSAALIDDLRQRGLLKDTLVVWGGEFGRTVYSQGTLKRDQYGRDHHPRNFCMWLAGGGVKGGTVYGETDDFSYNIVKDPVHLNELNATILHLMGIDHRRFTYKFQGLDQRLTGVEERRVISELLS